MNGITTTSGRHFTSTEGESILDAAIRQGFAIEHSCRTGRCGTCKATLVSGETRVLRDEVGLDGAAADEGSFLTCARSAVGEIVVDVEDLGDVTLFRPRTVPCRIASLDHLSADVLRVRLRLPPHVGFDYHAGQYIDVQAGSGALRSYSISSAPRSGQIELHIRKVEGGAMSAYWFDAAKVNDLLRFKGPLGTFFLRDCADADLIFLATGTGIAPIKAMLEDLADGETPRPRSITVYWGGRIPADLYWDPSSVDPAFAFVPVLSRADANWQGARGHVQDVMMHSPLCVEDAMVYACGLDAMVRDARSALLARGLPPRRFHSDAFLPSGPV